MNAVEIEQAISDLSQNEFDPVEFPYAFLQAFGNKETTLKRLRSGSSNKSDLGGVLQANHIHLLIANKGEVTTSLAKLKDSPATTKSKARYILATDGFDFEAEDIDTGETVACAYQDFPDHFGFFLPLAGISTVKQVRESSFDIRATSRLNRLYVELLKDNPEWGSAARRPDMNHFMARLIFCFFAEDTEIFYKKGLFSDTVSQMSERDSSNTHEVISEVFRAMNTKRELRASEGVPRWADVFPYVNGGLFSGSTDTPRFSKIARTYLLHTGSLDWTKINPDIFGSMIQAVTDEEERGSLGMHYTSVPNILKVLNPLFLDELRAKLEEAGDNPRTLLNLRKRISRIRVFDPACGSGNFLVIAYKQMREIENTINERRGEHGRKSDIPLTNFRGIELRDFPAEVARLALIIAEYQCDLLYRGQKEALQDFLPLSTENWITCGNALRIDWLSVCPPKGKPKVSPLVDLFEESQDQRVIDFEHDEGETYICGNPPYKGSNWRTPEQTKDLGEIFQAYCANWKALDYVSGWFLKASEYGFSHECSSAFVTTNSVCQGLQASILWPTVLSLKQQISFAHTSFKWQNLASHNAGVSVVIIGLSAQPKDKKIFENNADGLVNVRQVENINAYLLSAKNVFVNGSKVPLSFESSMTDGSGALDGGNLILSRQEYDRIRSSSSDEIKQFFRPYIGSNEFIKGLSRWCIWLSDEDLDLACKVGEIAQRVEAVKNFRANAGTRAKTAVVRPHKFAWINKQYGHQLIIPTVFSEKREYVTAGFLDEIPIINNAASIVHRAHLYEFSIISSRVHMCWVNAIAGKLEERIRYTSSTCYNTFPIPFLTHQNITDLTKRAQEILLAREVHFPATIAELYDPDTMPRNLRDAHDRNDELIERIYIGRRFKSDTECLEKLFDLYTEMTQSAGATKKKAK